MALTFPPPPALLLMLLLLLPLLLPCCSSSGPALQPLNPGAHPLLLLQLWSLPLHPLDTQFMPRLLKLATLERSDEAGAASRLLALGVLPALQQRLRVFGRTPLPAMPLRQGNQAPIQPQASSGSEHPSGEPTARASSSEPTRLTFAGDVDDAFCVAMAEITSTIGGLLLACQERENHQGCVLPAIRQLLSDRFSLVAVVQKGLAPAALLQAAPSESSLTAAMQCAGNVRGMFLLVSRILYCETLEHGNHSALARRLQQQLTTFLHLDAIRPHLETLCLPSSIGVCSTGKTTNDA
jgi:hypothetical protein